VIPGWTTVEDWLDEPVTELRLEIVRAAAPLAVLGFMSGRLAHADEWIGDAGFRVPDLGGKEAWYQPLFVPALPAGAAWTVAALMITSGLACCVGYKTRPSAIVFASTLAFVAVSDRLAAFTVSKLSPAVMLAIAAGPAGSRLSVDAWLARRRGEPPAPARRSLRNVRFLQLLVVTIYSASGIAKARGDCTTATRRGSRSRSRRCCPRGRGRCSRGWSSGSSSWRRYGSACQRRARGRCCSASACTR